MRPAKSKTVGRIVGLLALFLVAGCAVGPDFKQPVVKTPESYRLDSMPTEAMVNLVWWELFNDPVLYTLVTAALENNQDVQIAASRVEQARAFVGFNRADQFPRVDVEGGAGTGNFLGTRSPTTNNNFYLAPVLSWEIDFWGKFRRATDAARAELMASGYGLKTVELSLLSEVVSAYYRLLDFHQRLAVSQSTFKSRQKSLDIIQKRFDRGIVPELDVNQAQIELETAAASIPLYERQIAKGENALSILLGKLPGAIDIGKDLKAQAMPPDIPVDLPSNLLTRRPDISEAMYLLKAQNEKIGVAEAQRFPAISLTGLVGVASSNVASVVSDGGIWSVGGGLLGPLIDFKKNIQRVQIEEQRTRQALYRYEKTVLTAFREVDDSLAEIETLKKQFVAVGKKRKAAKNANKLSKERYDKGVSSYLEVLDTERSLFSAELELSEVKQLYLNAYVGLYKALGGGWLTKAQMDGSSKKP